MPKTSREFPATLNFGVELDMKQKLVAVGYMNQGKREYASPARNFLKRAWDTWYASLSEKDRREYLAILDNVKIIVNE